MEIIDQINSVYSVVNQWYQSREISTTMQFLLLISAVIFYVRGVIKSEKLITHTRDRKAAEENQKLKIKINNMLLIIESKLYGCVEQYAHKNEFQNSRIMIYRKSKPVELKSGDYLVEYHDSLHKSLYKTAVSFLFNELSVHSVADTIFDEEQEKRSAQHFFDIILFEIHGHAGTNAEIKNFEFSAMPYFLFLDMYSEICEACRNLRSMRELEIEREILEHRIPLFPKWKNLKKKK